MTIKIVPFKQIYPEGECGANKRRAAMFAHAGLDYLRASDLIISDDRPEIGAPFFYVLLPLLYMALELTIKALACSVDVSFNPKDRRYGHGTSDIIKAYSVQITIFKKIESNLSDMQLIESLEQAWHEIRYAEAAFSYDGADTKRASEIVIELLDELHKLTGTRFLADHFQKKHE